MNRLGRALTTYFIGKRSRLNIIAAFDVDHTKIDRVISGVKCYPMNRIKDMVESERISIAIMTVPADAAVEVTEQLVAAGIKGIQNYTTVPVEVPDKVFLDEYDMITSLEKIAYFVKTVKS